MALRASSAKDLSYNQVTDGLVSVTDTERCCCYYEKVGDAQQKGADKSLRLPSTGYNSSPESSISSSFRYNGEDDNIILSRNPLEVLRAPFIESSSIRSHDNGESCFLEERVDSHQRLCDRIQHVYLSLPCQYFLALVNVSILVIVSSLVVVDLWDLSHRQQIEPDFLSQSVTRVVDWGVTVVLAIEISLRFSAASQTSSGWKSLKALSGDILVLCASIASLAVAYAVEYNTTIREEAVAILFFLRIIRDAIRLSIALYFFRQLRETLVNFDGILEWQQRHEVNDNYELNQNSFFSEEYNSIVVPQIDSFSSRPFIQDRSSISTTGSFVFERHEQMSCGSP